MKPSFRLQGLQNEFRGNPRLQLGAAVICVILVVWVFLVLGDWRQAKLGELGTVQDRLSQVRGLAGQTAWAERADEAGRVSEMLSAEIPDIGSPGLAQADFQGWLRETTSTYGDTLRLDVQAPVRLEKPDGVVRVSATVSGGLPPDRVMQLIARIEGRQGLATIPVLTVRSDGNNQTFSLTVQGFYRLAQREASP